MTQDLYDFLLISLIATLKEHNSCTLQKAQDKITKSTFSNYQLCSYDMCSISIQNNVSKRMASYSK